MSKRDEEIAVTGQGIRVQTDFVSRVPHYRSFFEGKTRREFKEEANSANCN